MSIKDEVNNKNAKEIKSSKNNESNKNNKKILSVMDTTKCMNIKELTGKQTNDHEGYAFYKCPFLLRNEGKDCKVALYKIPPKKAGYPYHYHTNTEEVFYIISGTGLLRTPGGEREVHSGDLMFFPANESGAHKLTNLSETEELVYIDFDTIHDLDLAFYPDSNKFGVWGKDINKVYEEEKNVDYYQGE